MSESGENILARYEDTKEIPAFQQVRAKLDALNAIKDAISQEGDGYMQNGKFIPNKDYLRRYGMCVELTYTILSREIFREKDTYKPIAAYYEVRVSLPSGRYADGCGAASIYQDRAWSKKDDLIMTAHSRAVSRAIDDLLGVGNLGKPIGDSQDESTDEPDDEPDFLK